MRKISIDILQLGLKQNSEQKANELPSSQTIAKPNVVRSSYKVVVSEMKRIDKELDIDYPIYLYFQDESCNDELLMITKDYQIKVKYEYFSLVIEKSKTQFIYEHYITRNLTTKKHFLEVYNEALKTITESVV